MATSTKYLLIASTEAYSGKSGTIIGLAHQLKQKGVKIAYGKPLGTDLDEVDAKVIEEDVEFVASACGLNKNQIKQPLLYLTEDVLKKRLQGQDTTDYSQALQQWSKDANAELLLLEGASNIWEGSVFNLCVEDIALKIDAQILLVSNYQNPLLLDSLLVAKKYMGDRLVGVVINNIPESQADKAKNLYKPFLEKNQIPVLGLIPKNNLLRSVSVRELAKRLKAKVLSRPDRLDLMVESLSIGAMNVNSALEFFRKGKNMVVITGAGRTEIQIAALETSTNCLVLTGTSPPAPEVIARAEDLEVPILSVELDTLTTVEIVDNTFGSVRLQESIKVQFMQQLMSENFDIDQLLEKLGIKPAVTV